MKRYPGAQPFSTEQRHVFFGREQELNALRRVVEDQPMVVLFAKSGMGKSSLLNAGLIAKVKESGRFIPISIRFGAHTEGNTKMPLEQAKKQLAPTEGSKQEKSFLEKIKPKSEDSLWYHLKRAAVSGGRPTVDGSEEKNPTDHPPSTVSRQPSPGFLLVFDQFEELFTYPDAAIAAFGRQLSELLFSDIPDRFRQKLEAGLAESPKFLQKDELRKLHQPLDPHVVMAIRSDRMSLLNKLTPFLPDILANCHELAPLNRQQAESAILEPAYLPQEKYGFESSVFDFEDAAVEVLLDFLSEDGKQEIESFQLQILCEYAESAVVLKEKRPRVTAADFAKPDVILENYYLDKIAELPENERLPARKLIEEGLIFEEEERRLGLYEGQIFKTYGVSEDLLRRLLATHLIRSEPNTRGGSYIYELSHDTLVAPVLKAKAKRKEEERKIAEEEERQRREQELANLRKEAEVERQRAEREKQLRLDADNLRIESDNLRQVAEKRQRISQRVSALAIVLAGLAVVFYFQANKSREDALKAKAAVDITLSKVQELQKELIKYKRDVEIGNAKVLEDAEEYLLARDRWRAALQLDTTASGADTLRERIAHCGRLLGE